jgi:hypothetical protein
LENGGLMGFMWPKLHIPTEGTSMCPHNNHICTQLSVFHTCTVFLCIAPYPKRVVHSETSSSTL